MSVMTDQPPLPMAPVAGAVSIGPAVALVQDDDGGRVFLRGELIYAWAGGDAVLRRLAAVRLVRIKAARVADVAAAFGVGTVTLWRWRKELDASGVQGLTSDKRGPKGPSRLTPEMVADIGSRRRGGASLRAVAAAVGVSDATVRRALSQATQAAAKAARTVAAATAAADQGQAADLPDEPGLPVLPDPADRCGERAAARWGQLVQAPPVSPAPKARAGLTRSR
jgi:transposase-like protein